MSRTLASLRTRAVKTSKGGSCGTTGKPGNEAQWRSKSTATREPPVARVDLESAWSVDIEQSVPKGAGEKWRRQRPKETQPLCKGFLRDKQIWEMGSEYGGGGGGAGWGGGRSWRAEVSKPPLCLSERCAALGWTCSLCHPSPPFCCWEQMRSREQKKNNLPTKISGLISLMSRVYYSLFSKRLKHTRSSAELCEPVFHFLIFSFFFRFFFLLTLFCFYFLFIYLLLFKSFVT